MRQVICLGVIMVSMAVSRAGGQSIDVDLTRGDASADGGSAVVVQIAPGGGEMVILGPDSRYVTRAWRDHDRKMQGACTRKDVVTAEKMRTAEHP